MSGPGQRALTSEPVFWLAAFGGATMLAAAAWYFDLRWLHDEIAGLKNYLLVLGGVAFRPYFWTLLPAHVAHSSLALFFGDFIGAMTAERIGFLCGYALVLIGLSHVIYRRLRRRRRIAAAWGDEAPPGGDGSRKTPGPQ